MIDKRSPATTAEPMPASDIRRSVKFYPATTRMRVKKSSFSLFLSPFLSFSCVRESGVVHTPLRHRWVDICSLGDGEEGGRDSRAHHPSSPMMGATEPSRLSFPHTAPRYFEGRNFRSLTAHARERCRSPSESYQQGNCLKRCFFF